jgi:hypothetical protein
MGCRQPKELAALRIVYYCYFLQDGEFRWAGSAESAVARNGVVC